MKKLILILPLLIVGCSKEINSDQLVERNGIIYEVNSQIPFSGREVHYHENFQLQGKGNFKDGERHGPLEYYYENGQLEAKANYKDGELNGPLENYHENGQLEAKANYKDGELNGLWESYYENGELVSKYCYRNGENLDMSNCEE